MEDKTLKLRAYSEPAQSDVPQANPAKTQDASLELAKKNAQLEEEKSKSLELLKTIVQLRESLKHEQVKTSDIVRKAAELEAKAKEFAALDANQLAKKTAQLEEEKNKALEQIKIIEQLRESLKQEQAKSAEMVMKASDLQAKLNKLAEVEENQLAKKNAQLEEEKKKSLEQVQMIEQLRESLKLEQAKSSVDKTAELEAKTKEVAVLQAKVKDLAAMLTKISSIAVMGKSDNNA